MKINIIAAVSQNGVIGLNGSIPWHIPEDLKRFKSLTTSHAVVMGRKTFESLSIKPLPNRLNIILTSKCDKGFAKWHCTSGEKYYECVDLEDAFNISNELEYENVFIIGGTMLYHEALELDIIDTMYLTVLHDRYEGDTYFPEIDFSQWKEVERENYDRYSFVKYDRLHHA
jgi:dihydrofolate reductase